MPPSGTRSTRSGARRARDRGNRSSSSSPSVAAQSQDGGSPAGPAGWETLRKAWKDGTGRAWKLPTPPDKVEDRLAEQGWFEKALEAIQALPRLRYFRDPVTLPQLLSPGFVDKILGGQFDNAREQPRGGYRGPEDRPPPQAWSGSDAEAFERTKAALAQKLRQEGAA